MDCCGILSQAVTSVITSVISICISPVLACIAYPFTVSGNIRALEEASSKLEAAQTDVQNKVEMAELQDLTTKNQVINWLGRVEATKGEVDEIRKRYRERSRCFGTQFLNCWSNCWISKDATKKCTDVQELYEEGNNFAEVASQLAPRVPELPVGSKVVTLQEEANLQEIHRYIDNDQYDIIGIWGMGGVGKTRLLHLVHNKYKESSVFDVVVKVTASRACSIEKIQEELCENCGFVRGTSVESQARIISNYLKNRNFLILLDDVWGQIDLEVVGIPLGLGNQFKRKMVVITTRSSSVCGLMRVKKSLKVDHLDDEHALRLFNENVGDETINSHPLIPSLAVKVVKELGGLPLALIIIGQSMSRKRHPNEWKHAIDRLEKSGLNEIDDEKKIYHKLKLSYDSMNTQKLKDCFLICSLWPEDILIEKIDLIECWLGLGLLDLDISNVRNIYNPGYDVIGMLLSLCLLEEEVSGYVKMHDVIRDMALWIAHDEGKEKDKWVVLTRSVLYQVPHENIRWPRTERASLILSPREISNTFRRKRVVNHQPIPSHVNKLQYLRVNFYSLTGIKTLVQNLRSFCDLAFLDLRSCKLISFPQGVSNLVHLKYLNLSGNRITSVPEELKHVRNLRYLSVQNNLIDSFPQGVLSELKELLVLDLFRSAKRSGGGEYLTWLIKELGCLDNIRCLNITLQHPTHFKSLLELPKLPIRSLKLDYENETDTLVIPSSFIGNSRVQDNLYNLQLAVQSVSKIVIETNSHCQLGYLEFITFFEMKLLEMIEWPRNIAPEDLLPMLHKLHFADCQRLKDVSWALYLPCLRTLKLYRCDNIVQLIENIGGSNATKLTFPTLIDLSLIGLPKMQIICDQSITFPSLEDIQVFECPMLKKLPFQCPGKLKIICTERECWEQLEWEDNDLKQELQPLVKHDNPGCTIM